MTIFTIGYEGRSINEFLATLKDYGVNTVVDVRELPLSRKRGFYKTSLANNLSEIGIGYVHWASLGYPKDIRNRYRQDQDWQRYTVGFLKYLKTQKRAISELALLASAKNCALLCYEADFNFCHRSMVAHAVSIVGSMAVEHITASDTRSEKVASIRRAAA